MLGIVETRDSLVHNNTKTTLKVSLPRLLLVSATCLAVGSCFQPLYVARADKILVLSEL